MTYIEAEAHLKAGAELVYSFGMGRWAIRDAADQFSFRVLDKTAQKLKENLPLDFEPRFHGRQHRYKLKPPAEGSEKL